MKNLAVLEALGIDEKTVKKYREEFNNKNHEVWIELKRNAYCCENCNKKLENRGLIKRSVLCKIFTQYKTIVELKYHKYKCNNCKQYFYDINTLVNKGERISIRTIDQILNDLKLITETYLTVSKRYGVTDREVIDIFDKHVKYECKKLTSIICIDECHNGEQFKEDPYAVVISDFCESSILDIIQKRDIKTLRNYFNHISLEERLNVCFISIDMWETYKIIAHEFFPQALVCVDHYHVCENIKRCIRKIKSMVLKQLTSKPFQYGILKKFLETIISNENKDTEIFKDPHYHKPISRSRIKDIIVSLDWRLYQSINFFDDYRILISNCKSEEFYEKLDALINRYPIFNDACFYEVKVMFNNWKDEIKNSLERINGRLISNGPAEGLNSQYKKLQAVCNGVTNFKRFRKRLMFCINDKNE